MEGSQQDWRRLEETAPVSHIPPALKETVGECRSAVTEMFDESWADGIWQGELIYIPKFDRECLVLHKKFRSSWHNRFHSENAVVRRIDENYFASR
jgi:hypothetical protein